MHASALSDSDLTLLKLCVSKDEETENYLRKWESFSPWNDLNDGSLRLLPYLYRKLERLGLESVYQGKIKGTYSRYWYLYQRDVVPALELLASSSSKPSPFLILKGLALQNLIYSDDPPTRPSSDLDILIPAKSLRDWGDFLKENRFHMQSLFSIGYAQRSLKSMGFERDGSSIDLNWRLHQYSADLDLEDRLFQRHQEIEIRQNSFNTLSHTDHLLHSMVHGSGWNPVPPFRWVLDSVLLIQSGKIEWDIFLREVRQNGWRSPVLSELEFLKREFDEDVSIPILQELKNSPRHTAGTLMNFAITRRSRLGRRVCRIFYAEALTDLDSSRQGRLWKLWLFKSVASNIRLLREYIHVRRRTSR